MPRIASAVHVPATERVTVETRIYEYRSGIAIGAGGFGKVYRGVRTDDVILIDCQEICYIYVI